MSIEQEKMIVESLPSLYPMMQRFEEDAIKVVLDALPCWIPCSEKLPEYGEDVLTITQDDVYEVNHVIDDVHGEWFWEDNGNVIAWMPLPEPYRRIE